MQMWEVREVLRFVKIVVYRKDRELTINRFNAEEIDVQGKSSKYGQDAAMSVLRKRDEEKARAGDPGAREAIEEAERIIREAQSRGAVAFKTMPGMPAERVRGFDPRADEIVIVPKIAGG